MSSISEYLTEARARLRQVAAQDLEAAIEAGALVVDIRPFEDRERDGELDGAVVVQRNVLEWRLAPSSASRIFDLDADSRVIVMCSEGYQSSLAAATLQRLGLRNATDVIGGYRAVRGGPYDPDG